MVIPFRFHDFRHYSASIMHAIGIPDQYIMARGGWKTDTVLKAVYRNVINDEQKKFTDKINSHFTTMQHEMQHGDDTIFSCQQIDSNFMLATIVRQFTQKFI